MQVSSSNFFWKNLNFPYNRNIIGEYYYVISSIHILNCNVKEIRIRNSAQVQITNDSIILSSKAKKLFRTKITTN